MGPYWMWILLPACCFVVNAEDDDRNANTVTNQNKTAENVDRLVDELAKPTNATFDCDPEAFNDALRLVTFGRVYDYYEELLYLSKCVQKLEKGKNKDNKTQSDAQINQHKSKMGNIMQLCDPYIRELTHILSGKQEELCKLFDVLNNENKLRNVQSKLQKFSREHVNRWKQLKELKENVEALKEQDGYRNLSNMDKVENYLLEYDKAKALANYKDYIAKVFKSFDSDRIAMGALEKKLTKRTCNCSQHMTNLKKLKEKLKKNNESAKEKLEKIRGLRYLNDFEAEDLDKFGTEQDNMSSYDALITLKQEKTEKRKNDIIAKIMAHMDSIRKETDPE